MAKLIATVGTSRYLVSSKPCISLRAIPHEDFEQLMKPPRPPTPATLIVIRGIDSISSSWLKKTVETMVAVDDVFCEDFLSTILFLSSMEDTTPALDNDAKILLKSWGSIITSPCYTKRASMLSSGPYFLWGMDVHKIHKLYPDPYGAFTYGVVQSDEDPTRWGIIAIFKYSCLLLIPRSSYERVLTDLIPVPSRLYFPPPSESRPLSGKRLAIKDIYDIRGLKTSMCCKSYEACYGERSQTAKSIELLLALGAVIVAKAKTVQLASGLGPRDWIDYQCPFNPRGDGYLDPDCSSAGSAASVAAYDWLDFSIGSDSTCFLIKSSTFSL
jgi:hypothetical protein